MECSNELVIDQSFQVFTAIILHGAHSKVQERTKGYGEVAQVREIRIHDLRHTFASHYIMNGGSLTELQGLLGHSSPMMTLKYAHLAPGFLECRAQVVSFKVGAGSGGPLGNSEVLEDPRPRTLKLVMPKM